MPKERKPGQVLPSDRVRQPRGLETITVTYRYGRQLLTLVARDAPSAHAQARQRWGEPDAVVSLSTPSTILADLDGRTLRHSGRVGMHRGGRQGVVT